MIIISHSRTLSHLITEIVEDALCLTALQIALVVGEEKGTDNCDHGQTTVVSIVLVNEKLKKKDLTSYQNWSKC